MSYSWQRLRSLLRGSLRAGVPAALLSGFPSTFHSLAVKSDPFEATLAAGSILLPREQRRGPLMAAAIPVHLGLSLTWTALMAALLPRRHPVLEGSLAGIAIAILDLGVIGPRFPRIRALQSLPQIADHLAFGIIAATFLARQQGNEP